LIRTTLPKAKELRRVAEPIITLGKNPRSPTGAGVSRLRDRDMVMKLFNELGPRYAKRNGGYLRILKFGFRQGDNAPCISRTHGSSRGTEEAKPAQK